MSDDLGDKMMSFGCGLIWLTCCLCLCLWIFKSCGMDLTLKKRPEPMEGK